MEDRGGYSQWSGLARRHPRIAAESMERRAAAAEHRDARLVWQANAVIDLLSDEHPDLALALVHALATQVSLSQLSLSALSRRRPAEIADLTLASEDRPNLDFGPVVHRLDHSRLLALLGGAPETAEYPEFWLHRLSPEGRAAVYAECEYSWRDEDGQIAPSLVALLPRAQREREARRHLALPALVTRPAQRLPYAAFLPWEEARQALITAIRDPDAALRAVALSALVEATRYERDRLAELLALVRARRNEQDPVRCAMLTALAELPPSMWRAEHLDVLGQILGDALGAADLSYSTAAAAESLVIALLPFHPEWSAEWLATLVRERGQLTFTGLESRLADRDIQRLAPALLPVLQSWETREREQHLVAVARGLGRRLRVFPGLLEILERLVKGTRTTYVAVHALSLIHEHLRERSGELIPELVRTDPSWITQPVVHEYLHRRRQDLLTPFLGRKAYRGRFSTGKTHFVLPLTGPFFLWTPAQQALFAKTLAHAAGDTERDVPAVIRTICQLAALPDVPPRRLIELAGDPRRAVQEAALRALGRVDAGQGVPALLAALNDDRARIAIYALREALLRMPKEQAVAQLQSVPVERVTVAKEVVRLLGDLRSDAAYEHLLRLDAQELHRDVRVALVRALWCFLERDQTWPILERAAESSDPALAAIVARIQTERLSRTAEQRLAALLAGLLRHPDPTVRLNVLQRCAQLPLTDRERVLYPRLLEAMGSTLPDESAAAADAVITTYSRSEAPLLGEAFRGLLPNRRALQTAVDALRSAVGRSRGYLLPAVRAVLSALAADPLTTSLRLDLAVQALPWEELAPLLTQAAQADELHPDAVGVAVSSIATAAYRSDAAGLGDLEAALSGSADDRLRRVALEALTALADARGWDAERLARLDRFRQDASPLVAAAAQFTFPPLAGEVDADD
jgi:hypothetical protein